MSEREVIRLRAERNDLQAALAEAQRENERLTEEHAAIVANIMDTLKNAGEAYFRLQAQSDAALIAERQKVRQVFRYGFAAGCSVTHGDTPHPKFIDPVKESKAWENTSAALGLTAQPPQDAEPAT